MLIAIDKTGKMINLLDCKAHEISGLKSQDLCCPACKGQVHVKNGQIRTVHFAHVRRTSCPYGLENESYQHMTLKKELFYWLAQTENVKIEYFLKAIQQIPDLFVNDAVVVEVQCSSLPVKRLRERTRGYQSQGYRVIWLLGEALWLGDRLTELKQQLLNFSQSAGFYYWELDLKSRQIRLNYLIHEDITGKLHYLVKEFAFGSQKLLDVLRMPYGKVDQKMRILLQLDINTFLTRQLYYKQPKWLKIQETYYKNGQNLLTSKQVVNTLFPVGLNYLTYQFDGLLSRNFCQISTDLLVYYQEFIAYHQNHKINTVYAPLVYTYFFSKKNKDTDRE